jgi:hypothetical protein
MFVLKGIRGRRMSMCRLVCVQDSSLCPSALRWRRPQTDPHCAPCACSGAGQGSLLTSCCQHHLSFNDVRSQAACSPPKPVTRTPWVNSPSQDLPKLEAAARSALPRLSALAAKANAWRLVAAAEAAAEAAAAGEDARRGIAGIGLDTQAGGGTVSALRAVVGISERVFLRRGPALARAPWSSTVDIQCMCGML